MKETEQLNRTQRVFATMVKGITRYPRLLLLICSGLFIASIDLSCNRLGYHTQRDDLMSVEKDCQKRWHQYIHEFGNDDDMVVVVEGHQLDQQLKQKRMIEALEAIGKAFAAQPSLFDRIFYKIDLTKLQPRQLLLMSQDQLHQLSEALERMNWLLGTAQKIAWYQLGLPNLIRNTEPILQKLANAESLTAAEQELFRETTQLLTNCNDRLRHPDQRKSLWGSFIKQQEESLTKNPSVSLAEPIYFFDSSTDLAFMMMRPVQADDQSFTPSAIAVKSAREILSTIRTQFPDLEIGLTGLPVLENDEMAASDRDSTNASWIALAGVALLYLVVYRSFRYPILTVATLVVGTIWALGLTTLCIGYLTILSSTFAVMLIGMGDYGVLWIACYEQEKRHGHDPRAALHHTAIHAGPSILTAAITTSLAFYATMFADFQAVSELGFIAGSGVLLCALSCFLIMPALLILIDRPAKDKAKEQQQSPDSLPADAPAVTSQSSIEPSSRSEVILPFQTPEREWLAGASRYPRIVLFLSLLFLILGGALSLGLRYDHNLLHLQSPDLDSVRWEKRLLEKTVGTSWHGLSIASTPEQVLQWKKEYEQLPEVSKVVELVSLLPADQEAKKPLIDKIAQRLQGLPDQLSDSPGLPKNFLDQLIKIDRFLKENEKNSRMNSSPSSSSEQSPYMVGLANFRSQIDQLRLYLEANKSEEGLAHLQRINQQIRTDLYTGLKQLKQYTQSNPITITDLPQNLRERFIGTHGTYLLRIYAKENLWDYDSLQQFVNSLRKIDPEVTGKPFGTLDGLRTMKTGFQSAGLYAFIAIVLILLIDFCQAKFLFLALLPLLFGIIGTLGLLHLLGYTMNPANLIALPLIFGVGIDNGVHVLHDYRAQFACRKKKGVYRMSRPTGQGIFIAAVTTILGFGTLMISQHHGMFSLGLTLTMGVTICMIAALIILPCCLRLLDQRHLKTKITPEQDSKTLSTNPIQNHRRAA